MGDRAQVLITKDGDTGVFLYTHSQGFRITEDVKTALKRKQRWDDSEYLTRIIFDQMKHDDTKSETGFGIGLSEHGDIHTLVVVNITDRTVIPNALKLKEPISFAEFIDS